VQDVALVHLNTYKWTSQISNKSLQ